MRGRKNTPTNFKVINGNPGHRPLPENEPEFENKIPECPKWLRTKVAKDEWARVTTLLSDAGVITNADGNALAMYCYIVSEIDRLTKALKGKNNDVIVTMKMDPLGNEVREIKTNPRAVRLENYIKELRYYSSLFGLDPADRSKIKVPKAPQKSDGKQRFFK